jgi:hypothetical protein
MYSLLITWSDGICDKSEHNTALKAANYLYEEARHQKDAQRAIEDGDTEGLDTTYCDDTGKTAATIVDAVMMYKEEK